MVRSRSLPLFCLHRWFARTGVGLASWLAVVAQPGAGRWSYPTGEPVLSSPAIAPGGVVYIGSYDQHLYAIDADSGSLRWRFSVVPSKTNEVAYIYSSPAVDINGTVYFGTDEHHFASGGSAAGSLYAVNPDGTQKWRFPVPAAIYSDPSIGADGTVYFGCYDQNLYALNPDGTLKWRFSAAGTIFSDAVLALDGSIYFGCDDHLLYALSPTGNLKWTFDTGGPITAAPALGPDGTIYLGTTSSLKFFALNPDGSKRWEFATGERIYSSAAVASDGTIYFGSNDGYLYALNPDGTLKWRHAIGSPVRSSPALTTDGTIYVGADDGALHALDGGGNELWAFATASYIYSSPAVGADGTVYAGAANNSIYAVQGNALLAASAWPMLHHDVLHTGKAVVATNSPPAVRLTSPTNNAVCTAPSVIVLQADASDADGTVSHVEFFAGTNRLGSVAAAPYDFIWAGAGPGTYSLTAEATDNLGASATSAAATVVVRPPLSQTTLVNPGWDAGTFVCSFATLAGYQHTVWCTDSLTPVSWVALTNFNGDGGVAQFTDTAAGTQRYYLVQTQ